MLIDLDPHDDATAILRLTSRSMQSDVLGPLADICTRLEAQGKSGLIFDLSKAGRVSISGLAALVELLAVRPKLTIAYCGLNRFARRELERLGLERAMPLFPTIDAALAAPEFAASRQSGVQAVLCCTGPGTGSVSSQPLAAPWFLDILGKPLLQRSLDHLSAQGIRNVTLIADDPATDFTSHFRTHGACDLAIDLLARQKDTEGAHTGLHGALGAALVPLRSLRRVASREIILCHGAGLIELELAPALERHRASRAGITVVRAHDAAAIPPNRQGRAGRGDRDARIYILDPSVLDEVTDHSGAAGAQDILLGLIASGHCVTHHVEGRALRHIGDWKSYSDVILNALHTGARPLRPIGREVKPGLWADATARVSARADITGPCYFGAGAQVEAGSRVIGPAVVGAGAILRRRSLVRNSLILSGAELGRGALADGVIASGDWAVSHRLADGADQPGLPLDHVKWADRPLPRLLERLA